LTFFSFRRDGELLGVAALRRLDDEPAEMKSMHSRGRARQRRRPRLSITSWPWRASVATAG
jgi:hypothetical protein